MRKLLLALMLAGLTGACCPNPNISEEFTLTSPQKALLDHKTDLALEHFQKKPFYELLTDENLTSKAITENKNIQRELLQYPSCLNYISEKLSLFLKRNGVLKVSLCILSQEKTISIRLFSRLYMNIKLFCSIYTL